jgi:hypothetical protein
MRTFCLAFLTALAGCSLAPKLPESTVKAREARLEDYGKKVRQSFDLGKSLGRTEPGYVELQGTALFDLTLYEFYSPYAGARRLLDLEERHKGHPLLALVLPQTPQGKHFPFEDSEEFLSGNYPNAFEITLWDPFYRVALREYLRKPDGEGADFDQLSRAMKEAARLSPRFGDNFPLNLASETRQAFEQYLKDWPQGPLSDRFRFYLDLPQKMNGWDGTQKKADERLKALQAATSDELLKKEIKDTLDAGFADPGRPFLWSLVLPGTGQMLNGDVQGGFLMAGLSGAAWWWALSRTWAAVHATDDGSRQAAWGDAAWAFPLVAVSHGFAAFTSSSQARLLNVTLEWDILNRPRLGQRHDLSPSGSAEPPIPPAPQAQSDPSH